MCYKWSQEWEVCLLQIVASVGIMCLTNGMGVRPMRVTSAAGVGNMWLTTGGRSGIYIC